MCLLFCIMKKIFKEFIVLSRSLPGLLMAIFITSIVMMNLLANKSIDTHTSFLAIDCGIIFSWVTFLVMDMVVKRFGLRAGNMLTIMGLLINLFMAFMLIIASFIKGTWSMSYLGDGEVINNALDLTFRNSWYVLLGSSIAFLASGIVNNVLNHLLGKIVDKKGKFTGFALRGYISTFIGQFVDNLLFALIVSLNFFGWNMIQCITCALIVACLELLFEIIFSPIGFAVLKKWEKENVGIDYLNLIKGEQNESTNNGN